MNWNNKILAIIFFSLLGIWILNKTFNQVSDTSFKSTLMQVDTSSVNKIVLYPKGMDSVSITLKKNNDVWDLSNGNITTVADQGRVTSILAQISYIPTKRLISKKEENQIDYEVDEKSGKIVEIYVGDKMTNKVIFGRFNFNPSTRGATSYARLADDNEIYALDGMLSMSFDTDFNSFRNNKLLGINKEDIRGINYNGVPILPAEGNIWSFQNRIIDSVEMVEYLNGLGNITSTSFADDYSKKIDIAGTSIIFNVDNRATPVTIESYPYKAGFAIHSSENEAFFQSDSAGIYKKIFGDLDNLILSSNTVE